MILFFLWVMRAYGAFINPSDFEGGMFLWRYFCLCSVWSSAMAGLSLI